MRPISQDLPNSRDILGSLGQLALAASQAEAYAAQGLYYLLTDTPGDAEGAARVAGEFRSFSALYRLLAIAMNNETPLHEMLDEARADMQKRSENGDPLLINALAEAAEAFGRSSYVRLFINQGRKRTAVDYLSKVKALYDKRNECIHALELEVTDSHETHLFKRKKDGQKLAVDPKSLMEPCIQVHYSPGTSIASAIQAIALELSISSISLALLPITVQWHRRKGTGLDHSALVDYYVALSIRPLDEQIAFFKALESTLEAKIGAYERVRRQRGADDRSVRDDT